jgi:hypothetical protein
MRSRTINARPRNGAELIGFARQQIGRHLVLFVCLVVATTQAIHCSPPVIASGTTLSDAVFRYTNGDTAVEVKWALESYTNSAELTDRLKALYYLARYHHRNYELYGDRGALKRAYSYYHQYVDPYRNRRSEWLSDARFYKALQYLQIGKYGLAWATAVRDLKPELDPEIYIDHIAWTKDQKYAVYNSYKSQDLRKFLDELLRQKYANGGSIASGDRIYGGDIPRKFEDTATELKRWALARR